MHITNHHCTWKKNAQNFKERNKIASKRGLQMQMISQPTTPYLTMPKI